jgi:hypothetical protein
MGTREFYTRCTRNSCNGLSEITARSLAGFLMPKFRYEWFLFDYKDRVPDIMSKPFKTKAAAEKAREKYPANERRRIGVGIMQIPVGRPRRKTK